TWEGMNEARESLGRVDEWLGRLRQIAEKENVQHPTLINREQAPNARHPMKPGFENALDDDLNISGALGFLFETIRETNRAMDENKLDGKTAAGWLNWWNRVNPVLDFEAGDEELPEEVAKLAEARAQARLAKDFRKS